MDRALAAAHDAPVLAESPSFTEEEIMLLLLVLLGIFLATVAVVVLGFVWAWKAGRGSQAALAGWVIVGSFEAVSLVSSLLSLARRGPSPFVLLPAAALGGQVACYLTAKGRERRRPEGPRPS